MSTNLVLQLDNKDLDPDRLDRDTRNLRDELLDLDVISAELSRSEELPEGTKSAEAVTIGALAVSVLPTFLPKLVEYLQSWCMRAENRKVRIKTQVGDRSVEVEYSPSTLSQEELTQLVTKLSESIQSNNDQNS